ncbi:hypothetical protein XENOCAPTIV_024509 [Xenoophorus captivus]|uniref:Uncharacterized protein n=1 Tax=Xenoophorus captivus TaxID=1517983 RepID=A0ABV0R227_9TELE
MCTKMESKFCSERSKCHFRCIVTLRTSTKVLCEEAQPNTAATPSPGMHVVTVERTNSLLTGRNLQQNQIQNQCQYNGQVLSSQSVCHDYLINTTLQKIFEGFYMDLMCLFLPSLNQKM